MENNTNKTNPEVVKPTSEPKAKSKAVAFLSALIVVLAFVLAGLAWLYLAERKEAQETQQLLVAEKDSITLNLQNMVQEYNILETDNEALNAKLQEEQERAEKLLAELKQVKSVSYAKIKEYQKELGTLRAIMRDMVVEIDSLNTLNQQLIAENIKVKQEFTMSQKTVESLEKKTEEMTSTIAKGSIVRARDINPVTINKRGREITRARNVNKIKTCFTLSENNIAEPGLRDVYVRILGPDGFILAKSNADLFEFEGEQIVFSAKREVDYQNEDVEMCIFYDNNGDLESGKYEVSLFMDGYMIGFGEFELR
jgi:predicted nuclease with TOPRIM domain